MNRLHTLLACIAPFVFFINLEAQEKDRVAVTQETQVLHKGIKNTITCDIFYNKEKDAIIAHYYSPLEFVKMSNRFGEYKIYFPKTNSVELQQDPNMATTNELLYYFVNNKITDLGLSKEGFVLVKTTHEEDMLVSIWEAPATLKAVKQVKVVFKAAAPIYAEYLGYSGNILKKIYYSHYQNFKTFQLPLRVTEISFNGSADSTISRSVFSNVRTSGFTGNDYFNFKIPDDAKITK